MIAGVADLSPAYAVWAAAFGGLVFELVRR